MNRKELEEARDAIQAWLDGKELQCRLRGGPPSSDDWMSYGEDEGPYWNLEMYEFRIKSEPREWWMNPITKHIVSVGSPHTINTDYVLVREVLDND